MSRRSDNELLADIAQAALRVTTYIEGMTYAEFLADSRTQDAVVRNLEIVGEAARHLSKRIRSRHPDLPWKAMAGVRDRLIHDYSGVNLDIVWHIAIAELPDAAQRIGQILQSESQAD